MNRAAHLGLLRPARVHYGLVEVVGDIARVRAHGAALGELALLSQPGWQSLARVIEIDGPIVSVQVFGSGLGLSRGASISFLGAPLTAPLTPNLFGRVLRGDGTPRDQGPRLAAAQRTELNGPPVNPYARALPGRMIHTGVPMIDMFNPLVESQKLPIFAAPGEPANALLARVGLGADADLVVFAGLGLVFDEFHAFRSRFEQAGVIDRTVMVVNLAGDPLVERLLAIDLALAIAEGFALQGLRVLALLTDMTAYADALKEIGIALERIPAARGYTGDLYTQLARRYEKACDFRRGGSLTILAVTTLPGDDITHPVPDNTGYITEGQLYLRGGRIDPFASLSRLKQHVIGKVTRADHGPLANSMIRLFSEAEDAERKRQMAFELGPYDRRLLAYRRDFRDQFMAIDQSLPLDAALDRGWALLARHFRPAELMLRDSLVAEHLLPRQQAARGAQPVGTG